MSKAAAAPIAFQGTWFSAPEGFHYDKTPGLRELRNAHVSAPAKTGGHYFYVTDFDVGQADAYVLDFQSSSVIGSFKHYVFNAQGELVSELLGGIQSPEPNPYFLRHGRDLQLGAGHYRLVSEVSSPFFLGHPEPYLQRQAVYRSAIKPGNALTLLCLGLFLGLGLYYATLAFWRRRVADAMYALFILGNLLYNGTALLVFPDLLGVRWFYLISVPILFSNAAYVAFVVALLELRADTHPALFRGAQVLWGLFALFACVSIVHPNWSLELDRYGVGLFAVYGLLAAVWRAREGSSTARLYLASVTVFALLALLSISLSRIDSQALFIEHLGIVAVAVEVSLLALVLAHQFALLHSEKESALRRAHENFRIAHSDALTGLPNRYQLDKELLKLPLQGSLTFVDLDGLKHYNDEYGHQRGDELLCCFARHLQRHVSQRASVYRLSGDEFAIVSPSGDVLFVSEALHEALKDLRGDGFELIGASFGSVHVYEDPGRDRLKHMADTRMYAQKRARRASLPFERVPRRASFR